MFFNLCRSFATRIFAKRVVPKFSKTKDKSTKKNKRPRKKIPKKFKLKDLPVYDFAKTKKSDHRVYAWGLHEHGALGTVKRLTYAENNISYCSKPHRLTFGEYCKVTDVVCGYGFTAFAVKSNDNRILYGSGINTDSQLGYHPTDEKLKIPIVVKPRPIFLPLKGKTAKVLGLAAGRAHLLVLTDEGVYALGHNGYGQCGRPIIEDEEYLKSKAVNYIPNIKGCSIKSVSAGQDHSMLLTDNGEVYTFGWGADGQTGLAHYRNEYRPSLVKGDLSGEKIIKVTSAADCVLALSDKGKVFGWGNAEYSQLPCGDNQQINIATELKFCEELGSIKDIASGGSFCMVLNDEGEVYVWGFGLLGLGPKANRVLKPTMIPKPLFGINAYEPDIKVEKIFCGISHLGAITNQGHLFMWGRNRYGALGLGHRDDQYFPFKVGIGAAVKKISCGVDHTVSICQPFA
ncbi:RCC1-like G exchanging factor-like protein [Trichogramma pretiosum]|uniref:RCC1-like G exchanging factor-like protein n=1 Tax=Trichogramma pretiosum TaxID=7493 RepID=UPI0006C96FBE|nr:RCC1-like G exchanging factor-like protein [Trichogramma pretiosum]